MTNEELKRQTEIFDERSRKVNKTTEFIVGAIITVCMIVWVGMQISEHLE